MTQPEARYIYDMDPRYGWIDIQTYGRKELTIVIDNNGFTYNEGRLTPTCICSAWNESECGCSNMVGRW